MNDLISMNEAAKIIGMSRAWVEARVKGGEIPHLKFGKMVKIKKEIAEKIAVDGLSCN